MTRHRPFTARQRLATKLSTLLGASSVAATASAKEPAPSSSDQNPAERIVRDEKTYLWVDATRWWIDENGNAVAILQNQNRRVWEADEFIVVDQWLYACEDPAWLLWLFGSGLVGGGTLVIDDDEPNPPPANRQPVAGDDAVSTYPGTAISIPAIDLLDNDSDPDGDPLSIIQVGTASNGTVTLSDDGTSVTYSPNDPFHGTDSFTYSISDGNGGTATGTVTVMITKRFGAQVLIIEGSPAPDRSQTRETEGFGFSVSSAGDVNGDGRDELLITAPNYTPTRVDPITGEHLFLGQTYLFDVSDALQNAADGSVPRLDITAASPLFRGSYREQLSGLLAETIGDINNDGKADYLIGAAFGQGADSFVAADVVFGGVDLDSPAILAAEIDGTNGFRIMDPGNQSLPGVVHRPFAPLGDKFDFDGDGIDDLLLTQFDPRLIGTVSGYNMDLTILFGIDPDAGESFGAVFNIHDNALDPPDITAENGLQITVPEITEPGPFSGVEGHAVAAAGDVNNDGYGDLIIGAPHHVYDGQYNGVVYVLYGGPDGVVANNDGTALDLGAVEGLTAEQGFVIVSDESDEGFGAMVASVGDINNDGVEDVAIGTLNHQEEPGRIYIMFGANNMGHPGFDGDVHSSDWANQDAESPLTALGFVVTGLTPTTSFIDYYAVASAGDVNGDNILDVMVSKSSVFTLETDDPDEVYVIFGKDSQNGDYFGNEFDVRELDGSNGFQIIGPQARNIKTVAPAGDVNGDGCDDIVLGSPYSADPNVDMGEAYVVYGRQHFDPIVDFADFV